MQRVFLLVLFLLSACSTVSRPTASQPGAVRVGNNYFIDDSAPTVAELQSAVDSAIAGDDVKLAYVIRLERFTDGEGALNFGDLLLQIRSRIGDARFDSALGSLPTKVRDGAKRDMEAAAGMRRATEQYVRQHPKT